MCVCVCVCVCLCVCVCVCVLIHIFGHIGAYVNMCLQNATYIFPPFFFCTETSMRNIAITDNNLNTRHPKVGVGINCVFALTLSLFSSPHNCYNMFNFHLPRSRF